MNVKAEGESSTIKLKGPFDRQTAPEIRKRMLRMVRKKSTRSIEIDLSEVFSMDTAGIAVLVEVLRSLFQKGGDLKLTGLNEKTIRMLHLARLDQVFQITHDFGQ